MKPSLAKDNTCMVARLLNHISKQRFLRNSIEYEYNSFKARGGVGGTDRTCAKLHWRVQCLQNSRRSGRTTWNPQPVVTLAHGASLRFPARMTTLCVDAARRVAAAWRVLESLGANDDPLCVFGGSNSLKIKGGG